MGMVGISSPEGAREIRGLAAGQLSYTKGGGGIEAVGNSSKEGGRGMLRLAAANID